MGIKIQTVATNNVTQESSPFDFLNKEIAIFGNSFSNRSKEQFYSELSVLLNSGVNLKMALDLIAEMQKKKKDQKLVEELSHLILTGSSLSDAMKTSSHFLPYEFQAVRIGEQTGELAKITDDLREYWQRKNELRRQLMSSLSYPIIVLITAVLVVFFMLKYVVPMFVDIFKQNRVELPWLTQKIVLMSDFVNDNGLLLSLFLISSLIGLRWASRKDWYYRYKGQLQLKLPILGSYFKKIYLIQFTQAMALLTNAKIPVVNGIHLVRKMIRFYPLEKTLEAIETDIIQGGKLHESFAKHPFYDKKLVALLKVAEETNQTEYIFKKLYDQYSAEMKFQGQLITNAFNFLLTVVVGIIVGIILVAMYLPMFKLSSVIG